jgi:ankyrin repeat protein
LEIVELLIKYKANVNIQSTSGNTALHYAAGGVSGMIDNFGRSFFFVFVV